ncbi:LysR substrate-binding domain-containing protein [Usitatibacter palustris]|uniref:HTH-type transcriptional activator CmpR n=1 Tax=Usitatibacter palustris TaxID=2732487 RepID=A0A6M4HBZ8_9PROT|nr:LysR substrate-binding domain-containing protein [Usitatibacter palustris]QJR15507.1 HTH-type transcriptional activator CmpR [Usitatibacter palustris]
MRSATLRQLRVFAVAAGHLSFSRAAAELHLTAPAVSLQIAELERHAGVALFERLGKRVYLTPAGEAMRRASTAILDQLRALEEELGAQRGVEGGLLNVGVISAGDYFFPTLLSTFCERHERVAVSLSVCNREELLQRLDRNQVDLGIMGLPPEGSEFNAKGFATHPIVVIASPSHRLAGARKVPLSALAKEPYLAREQGSLTRVVMDEAMRRARMKPHIVIEAASNETLKQAVSAGFGIAFMSAHAIGLEVEAKRLVVLDVVDFPIRRPWYCVHRKGKRLPPVALAFEQFLHDEAEPGMLRLLPTALKKYWK